MRLRRRHAWGAALIALFALPVLQPKGFSAVEDPPADFFAWFSRVGPLNPRLWDRSDAPEGDSPRARELERVLAELAEARHQDAVRADDLAALRDALELDRLPVARIARILRAHDPSSYRRSILIDRGTEDGIEEGFPVVAGGIYVGRIQVVRTRSALVRLVTDPQSRLEVAVRTDAGRRVTGFLRRRGPVGSGEDLEIACARLVGDVGRVPEHVPVFTSNADALVPAGLLVGYVSQVSDPEADGFPTLTVRPALDLGRSTEVLVLLRHEER
jgi:rod shape-determining protein MreC